MALKHQLKSIPPGNLLASASQVDAANTSGTSLTRNHIPAIDGLRGVAIGLVLLHHVWWFHNHQFPLHGWARVVSFVAAKGDQGVSLFLVLSGFCLALPALRHIEAGRSPLFTPSEFFARRCLRILPPYYAALLLSVVALHTFLRPHAALMSDLGGLPGGANLAAHVLLVQNLTPYATLVNLPFWSLGLEWQWYLVFPAVLVLTMRAPWLMLAGCCTLSVAANVGIHAVGSPFEIPGTLDTLARGSLPVRLAEFCCGVIAAQLFVKDIVLSRTIVIAALLLPLLGLWHGIGPAMIAQPFFGIGFSALLLCGLRYQPLRGVLSLKPLVALGAISYSVYLVHYPIVESIEVLAPLPLRRSPAVMLLAAVAALAAGVLFYTLVERPCLSRVARRHVLPYTRKLFTPVDVLWFRLGGEVREPVRPRPAWQR